MQLSLILKPRMNFAFDTEATDEEVKKGRLLATISPNLFAAIKLHGMFDTMHVRVAPKQEKPYPKFVEIIQKST